MGEGSAQAAPTERRATVADGAAGPGRSVLPLAVSGLVVGTTALVAALRPYLPQLIDITPLDGGRLLLQLTGADQDERPAAE